MATFEIDDDVLAEFESSLDADIDKWSNGIERHIRQYEQGDVKKYTGSGVMIAFMLPKAIASKLTMDEGEGAEELHVTVLYLGKAETIDDDKLDALKEKLEAFCAKYSPLEGSIGGYGRFPASESTEGRDVLIGLVDVPRLEALREQLIALVTKLGIAPVLNHGYTPHVTIAYVEPTYNKEFAPLKTAIPLTIDSLTCSIGKDRVSYPLVGSKVLKGVGPTASSVHSDKPLSEEEEEQQEQQEQEEQQEEEDDDKVKKDDLLFSGPVSKVDDDKRLVFGWVTLSEVNGETVVDKQGDVITESAMEDMAHKYVLTCRTAGEMHEKVGIGKLVESIVFTKEKQKALGIDLGKSGWWCGFHVTDKEVWKKVKDGTYSAFSIHGKGIREKINN